MYRDFTRSKQYVSLLGVVLAGCYVCSYTCYIGHHDGSLPHTAFSISRLMRLAVRFCHHGCVRNLFLDSNIIHGPSCAVRQLIHITGSLHLIRHFGKCVRLGDVPNTDHRLMGRTKLCTSHLDIGMRVPGRRGLGLLTPRGSRGDIFTPVGCVRRKMLRDGRRQRGFHRTPHFTPTKRDARVVMKTASRSSGSVLFLSSTLCKHPAVGHICCSKCISMGACSGHLPTLGRPPLIHRGHLCRTS